MISGMDDKHYPLYIALPENDCKGSKKLFDFGHICLKTKQKQEK